MRDVREFTETVTSFFTTAGTEGPPVSTINATHRVGSSARDEAISTTPNGEGEYFYPTTYRGWFYGSTSLDSDYKAKSSGLARPRRYYGRYTWSQYSSGMNTSTLYGCNASNRPAVPGWLVTRVESQLNAKMYAQNWNIGQFLAELPETIGFVTETIRDIVLILRVLKERRFKDYDIVRDRSRNRPFRWSKSTIGHDHDLRARRRNRSISKLQAARGTANAYLTLMYAIAPMLSDIHEAMRTLEQGIDNLRDKRFSVSADGEEPIPPPAVNAGTYDVGSSFEGKWGVKGEVAVKVKSPTLATLDSMGLLDPLSVAWELTALSFVIDWFVPVGAFLRSLSGHWGLIFSHGYRTSYATWSADVRFSKGAIYVGGTPGRITGRLLSFDRQEYLTFPIPVPYVQGLDPNLLTEYSRYMTLLSLGIQRLL